MIDTKVLGNFTGTEAWHRYNPIMPKVLLTDGALYVANEGGAFWLMDIIGSVQHLPKVKGESFQVWRLTVHEDNSALVTCDDGNENILYTQNIEYSDFSPNEFKLYACQEDDSLIILLPSEY